MRASSLLIRTARSVAPRSVPRPRPQSTMLQEEEEYDERSPLSGELPEMDHMRGGLGGVAPIHLNVDSRIVHGFRWVSVDDLLEHEEVRVDKASALSEYIATQGGYATIPSVIACSRTNTIIDGHHRHSVLKSLGYPLCPVLYIDYGHRDVLVHGDSSHPAFGLTKQQVVDAAQTGQFLAPKSTNHVIRAGNGSLHPIVTMSPTAGISELSNNLTGGWSYKPSMVRGRS